MRAWSLSGSFNHLVIWLKTTLLILEIASSGQGFLCIPWSLFHDTKTLFGCDGCSWVSWHERYWYTVPPWCESVISPKCTDLWDSLSNDYVINFVAQYLDFGWRHRPLLYKRRRKSHSSDCASVYNIWHPFVLLHHLLKLFTKTSNIRFRPSTFCDRSSTFER